MKTMDFLDLFSNKNSLPASNLINSQIIYYDAQLPANYNRPQ
jgi:hypothetical protein